MKPQCKQVLQHMMRHGFITQDRAKEAYGVSRLASRIGDLEADGYEIEHELVSGLNRDRKRVHFSRYSLRPNQPDVMDKVHAGIEDRLMDARQSEMFERKQEAW